jgi:hypothetical protein
MMHPAVTTEDWSLMDCQEYFVDLEMSLAGVATALEVSAPGQLRDDQMGVYRELELEVGIARGLANKLRARHLEAYDLQGGPVAFADSSGIRKRLRTARMRLDEKLAASLPADHGERAARMLLQRLNQEGDAERPSAPPPSPPDQGDTSEGEWPRFSGANGGPPPVPAGLGDACQALPSWPFARCAGRRDAEILHAPGGKPNDRAGT